LLRQVVQNLTQNAMQHCQGLDGGPGEIGIRLWREGNAVRLTVWNTGEGIPDGDRGKIFERFYRVDQSRARERGGAGLGLSLAREIARAHGGDLTLDDAPEGVTAFTLTLPNE
jgi:signal transduction histidine kinase